jgi:hypothetical protein
MSCVLIVSRKQSCDANSGWAKVGHLGQQWTASCLQRSFPEDVLCDVHTSRPMVQLLGGRLSAETLLNKMRCAV